LFMILPFEWGLGRVRWRVLEKARTARPTHF